MTARGPGWQLPVLALAGLAVLSATAYAAGSRGAEEATPMMMLAPVAAPAAVETPATQRPDSREPAARRAVRLDPRWVADTARRAGIPAPALRAYARAQLGAPAACRLGWTTLAAIGWVESQHGTLDGRTLHADGHSSSAIIGPPLDGGGDVAAIAAEPSGTALHGDPTWDHAVGPMQFLPATWAEWGTDGDGDGTVDPHDLDDAAAAAAAYLCADGRSLTGAVWATAVLSYNHDAGYVGLVHAAAEAYAERTA